MIKAKLSGAERLRYFYYAHSYDVIALMEPISLILVAILIFCLSW